MKPSVHINHCCFPGELTNVGVTRCVLEERYQTRNTHSSCLTLVWMRISFY
uniref:Uncharacterized protein n=1 Tax=Lepeophtheirus salmonis TaxID=72036 RepID=A0A0K2UZ02_LEPSM